MSTEGAALARIRWAQRKTITCQFCGQEFEGAPGRRYCSKRHQNAAASRRYRDKRRATASAGGEVDDASAT